MTDLVVGLIIISILVFSINKIIVSKKKGVKCIGCEFEGSCSHHHNDTTTSSCNCSHTSDCSCDSCDNK